jgi:hypothetical protein
VGVKNPAEENDRTAYFNRAFRVPKLIIQPSVIAMLAQISTAASATAGIVIALVTGAAAVAKKYIRRQKPKAEYITRAEFQHEMSATRDRIGAGYLALADKLDANHKESLSALDRLAVMTEQRLDRLETGLARVDERTKF